MAITVNGDPHPFHEGMTIQSLLKELKYSYPMKTVYIGEARIPKEDWEKTAVRDGDEVRVIHLMAGG